MNHKIELGFTYEEFDSLESLSQIDTSLLLQAKEVSLNAYAPYSNIHIGAALRLDSGEIISGNNQENSAYPSGLCAERLAAFYAHAHHPSKIIQSIAIYGYHGNTENTIDSFPCGACRQVLREYEILQKHPIRLIVTKKNKKACVFSSIENILPFAFH